MPSSRRSQNLPLEDSLIPSSTSSRSKKPSDKAKAAKADAARKANADAAARTIVEAAAKANTAGTAAKANCLRNSKGHTILFYSNYLNFEYLVLLMIFHLYDPFVDAIY
jgi:hypothetical protein